MQLDFGDILAEPEGMHSFDCAWRLTARTFTCVRSIIYKRKLIVVASKRILSEHFCSAGIDHRHSVRYSLGHSLCARGGDQRVVGDAGGALPHHPSSVAGQGVELPRAQPARSSPPLVRSLPLVDSHSTLRHEQRRHCRDGLIVHTHARALSSYKGRESRHSTTAHTHC